MSDISINIGSVQSSVTEIVNKIQTDIIDASATSQTTIINAIENSSGDFIESLKEEVKEEVAVINLVGELLISMANYIQSAANEFNIVDSIYNSSII